MLPPVRAAQSPRSRGPRPGGDPRAAGVRRRGQGRAPGPRAAHARRLAGGLPLRPGSPARAPYPLASAASSGSRPGSGGRLRRARTRRQLHRLDEHVAGCVDRQRPLVETERGLRAILGADGLGEPEESRHVAGLIGHDRAQLALGTGEVAAPVEDLAEVQAGEGRRSRPHVAERHEPLAQGWVWRVGGLIGGGARGHASLGLERSDLRNRPRGYLRRQQRAHDATGHLEAHREAGRVEDRGREVERGHAARVARRRGGARCGQRARFDRRDDAVWPVPRAGRPRELGRVHGHAGVRGEEAVVGADEDPGRRLDDRGQPSDEAVGVAIRLLDGPRSPRAVADEAMRESVDALEVDHQQVGLARGDERLREASVAPRDRHDRREMGERIAVEERRRAGEAAARRLMLGCGQQHVLREVFAGEITRADEQRPELRGAGCGKERLRIRSGQGGSQAVRPRGR